VQHQNLELPGRFFRRGVCRYVIGTIRLCCHATILDACYPDADIGRARKPETEKTVTVEELLVPSVNDGP
jgi:hypothetical protein